MLVAVSKSKDTCKQFMNSAAIDSAGLTSKINWLKNNVTTVILKMVFINLNGIKFVINYNLLINL